MDGARLRELRKLKKMTQRDLALRIGLSPDNGNNIISRYEHNRSNPDNETLSALARVFDVSTDYLLNNELSPGLMPIEAADIDTFNEIAGYLKYKRDARTREMLRIWDKLNDNQKDRYLKFIKEDPQLRNRN